jgi:RNA polymerase sigma-70 factor (ECF subfamily)
VRPARRAAAGCRCSAPAWRPTGTRCAVRYIRRALRPRRPTTAAVADPDRMTADSDADALLLERIKLGDVRAFEMLVVKYQRRIERLIGRMVRDSDLVQDIAQETFIRAYRAIPQFRGDSAFYTWLYRIAVNTAKKALVDLKRDPLVTESARLSRDEEGEETSRLENELSDGETPEALLASRQVADAVNSAIEDLSEDLRQAITLREIEGLSYEEIAGVMNCPIGTVRSRIFRAREAIAERLRPLLDTRAGERW